MTATAAPPATKIDVENPATGQSSRASRRRPRAHRGAGRARPAPPSRLGGARLRGPRPVFTRCQKWVIDNSERVIETIVSETGKAWEDAQMAEVATRPRAFGFWAKNAEKYLADERVKTASPFVKGRKLIVRYAPVGVVGVIGPWNYPLTNSFGDCIPALAAGNAVILKPSEVTPLTSLLMGECCASAALPEASTRSPPASATPARR